jgi:mannose-6-phosphate isomerase-like protein (cupin superfamily)
MLHGPNEGLPLGYSLAWASLPVGAKSLPHRLRESSEVYYFLLGQGRMHVGGEEAWVTAGDTVLVPPGVTQWLSNEGETDLEFLCIVDPGWRAHDEEV